MLNFLLITEDQQTSHVLPFYTESELTTDSHVKTKNPFLKDKITQQGYEI